MEHITLGASEARDRLAHILNEVAYGGQRYIVERRGQPLAAILPADEYAALVQLLCEYGAASPVHGIPARVRFDGSRYFVSDDQFDLYGEGATLDAARQDYWLAAQEYRADLEADADRLAPYLAERLEQLRVLMASETDTKPGGGS
jgi:prevent-host-death family protein